jgi:hypothetical protein
VENERFKIKSQPVTGNWQPMPDPLKKGFVYPVKDYNFQLKPGGKAIDAGCILPNITDNYTGKSPDLGALEYGRPTPHYGPR